MQEQNIYVAIDLKSFYASVECRERGLDPLTTNLVVADTGYDIKLIQEILGHSSVNTTKIYTHLYDEEVEKTMQEHPLAHFKMKNAMEFCAL